MNFNRKIRVLVVDDSAVVRRTIVEALSHDPELEVVGTACDPYVARDKILELNPDVLTMDVEMPRMDGITFLRTLLKYRPIPAIVISSITQAGSRAALDALAAGAVDVIAKPTSAFSIGALREQLPHRVKGAARAQVRRPAPVQAASPTGAALGSLKANSKQLILIGASTGGTEAISRLLTALPDGLPGICIVQHIPAVFSATFAERLNELCKFEVREAVQGDEVRPGLALVAPGDYHMSLAFEGGRYRVRLDQGPPLHFVRPSVDVLFNSAAPWASPSTIAVLLTGMGSDGAMGMKKLKEHGAATLVQDEATCAVYGMPRAAVNLGVVDKILPLDDIPAAILRSLHSSPAPAPAAAPSPVS